jgi:hypothetical protein
LEESPRERRAVPPLTVSLYRLDSDLDGIRRLTPD